MALLIDTLDELNESMFYSRPIPESKRRKLAGLVAGRQGKPGSYADMFAPLPSEDVIHYRLFTGEHPSPLSALHIIGEECCRSLLLLGVNNQKCETALGRASDSILPLLTKRRHNSERTFPEAFFCCPKCTCGLWRHMSARTDTFSEERLSEGLTALREWRNGKGGWTTFPPYYTLFVLTEVKLRQARNELSYAAKSCEVMLAKMHAPRGKYAQRRVDVLKAVLSIV